jgi:hypothetical protein
MMDQSFLIFLTEIEAATAMIRGARNSTKSIPQGESSSSAVLIVLKEIS